MTLSLSSGLELAAVNEETAVEVVKDEHFEPIREFSSADFSKDPRLIQVTNLR